MSRGTNSLWDGGGGVLPPVKKALFTSITVVIYTVYHFQYKATKCWVVCPAADICNFDSTTWLTCRIPSKDWTFL